MTKHEAEKIFKKVGDQLYRTMRTLQPAILNHKHAKQVSLWTADLIVLQKSIGAVIKPFKK